MLLHAPIEFIDHPNEIGDLIYDTLVPRDPWKVLAAGVSPKITQSRTVTLIQFNALVNDLDWAGFSLFQDESFLLGMMQRDQDGRISLSVCRAEMGLVELEWNGNQWQGPVSFRISRVVNHTETKMEAAA